MKQVMSPAFRLEASQHGFVAACEHCDHFVADAVEAAGDGLASLGACGLLFPTRPHRLAAWAVLGDGEPLPFCKMFEPDRGGAVIARRSTPCAADDADRPAGPADESRFDTTGDPVALTAATRQTR
jgi:hypothetical protein